MNGGSTTRQLVEQVAVADTPQIGHRRPYALLGQHACNPGLEPGPNRDQPAPVPDLLPQYTHSDGTIHASGNRPIRSKPARPMASSCSYLTCRIGKALDFQRMRQMHVRTSLEPAHRQPCTGRGWPNTTSGSSPRPDLDRQLPRIVDDANRVNDPPTLRRHPHDH